MFPIRKYQDWELAEVAQAICGELYLAQVNGWKREVKKLEKSLAKIRKEQNRRQNVLMGSRR